MGLMISKMYIDSFDPPVKHVKGISVYYGSREHILYSNLVLSEGIEIQLVEDVNPYIELSYPLDLKIAFSLKENALHFLIIGESEERDTILRKTDTVKYPWLPSFSGIKVSRITGDEYKEYQNSMWQNLLG